MSKSTEREVRNGDNENFINCIVLSESYIMVATTLFINIFDQSLTPITKIDCEELYKGIVRVWHLSEALDKTEFIVALYPTMEPEYKHRYEGSSV